MSSKKLYEGSSTGIERYNIWLNEVCAHYRVRHIELLSRNIKPVVVVARQTFYWLCWRDKINLYRLSEHLGKHRSTANAIMGRGIHNRQKEVENFIYEKVATQERKQRTEKDTII